MMNIEVCIGGECHVKGARHVIEELKELIERYQLQSEVKLKPVFCTGHCEDAVSIHADGRFYSVAADTVPDFFVQTVLPAVRQSAMNA